MANGSVFFPLRLLALAAPALLALPAAAQDPDNETLGISTTPDAEPNKAVSVTLGAGAGMMPAYEGSKNFKAVPFPLIDIRGLADDRIFVSSLRGIGVNVVEWGDLRAGVAVSYQGGRSSHDDDRLRGLSDISGGAVASGFVTYSLKPFAFELKAQNIFGPAPGTEVTAGATWSFVPLSGMRVSIGPETTWADRRYDRSYFGVTDDQAIAANAAGNPLHPYSPGSGLKDAGLSATLLYQITDHWGLAAHAGVTELVGDAARNSPLTQRDIQPSAFIGLTYRF
jgi:MipA family protein